MEELDNMEVQALQRFMEVSDTLRFLGGPVRREYLLHNSHVTGVQEEIRTQHRIKEVQLVRCKLLDRERKEMGEDTFKKLMQLRHLEVDLVAFVNTHVKRRRVSENNPEEDEMCEGLPE